MNPSPKRPKPVRDPKHLAFVRTLPCLICGAYGVDAHHIRAFQPRTMGKRVGDDSTVPLCRACHDELHRGKEEAFWAQRMPQIDPLGTAWCLYQHTGDAGTCEALIRKWRLAA